MNSTFFMSKTNKRFLGKEATKELRAVKNSAARVTIISYKLSYFCVQRYSKEEEARRALEDGVACVSLAQAATSSNGAHASLPQASRATAHCHAQSEYNSPYQSMFFFTTC